LPPPPDSESACAEPTSESAPGVPSRVLAITSAGDQTVVDSANCTVTACGV